MDREYGPAYPCADQATARGLSMAGKVAGTPSYQLKVELEDATSLWLGRARRDPIVRRTQQENGEGSSVRLAGTRR
jgi:hypothetical protein